MPEIKGQYNYHSKRPDIFTHVPEESQVKGSTSRYWHPQYRVIHSGIRQKLEEIIGRKLYNTYYYDRFYFAGQELTKHTDRDACEISVSVHVSTNLEGADADWPFWIKTPDGDERSAILKAGDGLLYKGCERPTLERQDARLQSRQLLSSNLLSLCLARWQSELTVLGTEDN